jgi:hypothetical protein
MQTLDEWTFAPNAGPRRSALHAIVRLVRSDKGGKVVESRILHAGDLVLLNLDSSSIGGPFLCAVFAVESGRSG